MIALAAVALLMLALIGRETIFASPAATPLRLATASVGTVKAVVSGTGSLVPVGQVNIGFRVAGQLTEIDVKVGDKVTAGQVLARTDSSSQQAALSQAQASLAAAQANLQAAQTPLTGAQVAQLQHALSAAQQNYDDTVASVNAQNQADATSVANDEAKYATDGCTAANPPAICTQDAAILASDKSRQNLDRISGQGRINSAAAQVTSATDNLTVQTQVKPNTLASAQAQVASTQAQVQAAQLALNQTSLTAPSDGAVASINGVVGEMVSAGGGTTQQAPGTSAPQSATSSSTSSAAGGAFMVLTDTSSFVAIIPFAETDAARITPNQNVSLSFDAVPDLVISGHVLPIGPNASVVSNVVNYYATFVLNHSDLRLRSGMTTTASVTVAQADNVVNVPNSAIKTANGTSTVTVYSAGQQVQTEVVTGIVGDTTTEIKGGLKEGDQVVLPTPRTTGGPGGGGNPFRGGGFGGAFRGGG
jgi:HlyD family secretion protein